MATPVQETFTATVTYDTGDLYGKVKASSKLVVTSGLARTVCANVGAGRAAVSETAPPS
ncbi:MAG: hypothetical protein ACYSWU_00785 [Planctomycetota bacterium]